MTYFEGNDDIPPEAVALIARADPLISPFLAFTDPNFINTWHGIHMLSKMYPVDPKSKAKLSVSSPLTLKIPRTLPSLVSEGSDPINIDNDGDPGLQIVAETAKISVSDPIAVPPVKIHIEKSKTASKVPIDHEPFDVTIHMVWSTTVSPIMCCCLLLPIFSSSSANIVASSK